MVNACLFTYCTLFTALHCILRPFLGFDKHPTNSGLNRIWQQTFSLSPTFTLDCCNNNLRLISDQRSVWILLFSVLKTNQNYFLKEKKKFRDREKHGNGCQQHWSCVINRTCTKLEKKILLRDSSDGVRACVCSCECVCACVKERVREESQPTTINSKGPCGLKGSILNPSIGLLSCGLWPVLVGNFFW